MERVDRARERDNRRMSLPDEEVEKAEVFDEKRILEAYTNPM